MTAGEPGSLGSSMENVPCGKAVGVGALEMVRRHRVLYVHNCADLYGASRSLIRLVGPLDSRRFEAVVLLPGDGPLRERLEAMGIEVVIEPRLCVVERRCLSLLRVIPFLTRIPVAAIRMAKLIKELEVDLVHTNVGVIVDAPLAARLAGRPHVWHIREWFQEFGPVWPIFRGYIQALSAAIVCVSKPIAGQFSNTAPVQIINNAFHVDEFRVDRQKLRQQFRGRYQLSEAFVIGCVGRIKLRRKGQEVLVEALGKLNKPAGDIKLVIVGAAHPDNASHLQALKDLVEHLELHDSVVFTGELDDPRSAYAAMDLLVLPSAQPEPFGGVIMEAMAMKLPVIATAIGGPLEVVVDGVTGFLVAPGDAEALAEKIEFLYRERGTAAQMGHQGYLRLCEKFDLRRMVAEVEQVYTAAIRNQRGR